MSTAFQRARKKSHRHLQILLINKKERAKQTKITKLPFGKPSSSDESSDAGTSMGKEKKEKKSLDESQTDGGDKGELNYEERLKFVSVISKPMASKKLTKKVSSSAQVVLSASL